MAQSKLELSGARTEVSAEDAGALVRGILQAKGCTPRVAQQVADHLVDASLSGVESHGIMRVLQYAEQFDSGYMVAGVAPEVRDLAKMGLNWAKMRQKFTFKNVLRLHNSGPFGGKNFKSFLNLCRRDVLVSQALSNKWHD